MNSESQNDNSNIFNQKNKCELRNLHTFSRGNQKSTDDCIILGCFVNHSFLLRLRRLNQNLIKAIDDLIRSL